jgi:hypothetical protein
VPHGTYVQFGNRGDKLIATYHGDHAYSFDVTASEQPPIAAFRLPPPDEARCHRPSQCLVSGRQLPRCTFPALLKFAGSD